MMRKRMKRLLCLLLFTVMSLTACGTSSAGEEAVLKIDGQEIMKYEYMVYLYTTTQSFISMVGEDVWNMDFDGQTADELVEERTISTLQSVIAAEKYAKDNDISLTAEQKKEAKQAAEQFMATVSKEDLEKMGLDTEKLIPLMEASYLYSLVYEQIAAECGVDATDMETYYQMNRDAIKADQTTFQVESILLQEKEKADEAMKRAKAGEDFAELFAEYDTDPTVEDGGKMTLTQAQLQAGFGLTESLEVGDITGPVQVGEGYFILKTAEKKVPTEEEVKDYAEKTYQSNVQTEYAETRLGEMMKAQSVEKIESVWETLEKFH